MNADIQAQFDLQHQTIAYGLTHGLGPSVGSELGQGLSNIGSIFSGIGAAAIDISTPCLAYDLVQAAGGKFNDCYQDFANAVSGGAACDIQNNGFFAFGNIWGSAALGGEASLIPKGAAGLGQGAADLVRAAKPVGSALKNDVWHPSASFAVDEIIRSGTAFRTVGGDGVSRILIQAPGEVNGVAGRFEWILDGENLTHQMFVRGGTINGIPIKP